MYNVKIEFFGGFYDTLRYVLLLKNSMRKF